MDKLNLGSGRKIKEGWINLDIAALPGVDVVHDIQKLPLPFRDGQFDEILCEDVLEHVEYIPILKDLHRVLCPGGKITIQVPHFSSAHNFRDPTHRRMFSVVTFDFFVKGSFEGSSRDYYFDYSFSAGSNKILFERGSPIFWFNPVIEWFVNISPTMQKIYEGTWMRGIFPACNILVTLTK